MRMTGAAVRDKSQCWTWNRQWHGQTFWRDTNVLNATKRWKKQSNTKVLRRTVEKRGRGNKNEWEKEAQDLSNAVYVKKLGITAKKQ